MLSTQIERFLSRQQMLSGIIPGFGIFDPWHNAFDPISTDAATQGIETLVHQRQGEFGLRDRLMCVRSITEKRSPSSSSE